MGGLIVREAHQLGWSVGILPQKNFKNSGFCWCILERFWVHLTSADTRALTARASRIVSQSQRHGDRAKKERAPLLELRPPMLKGVGPSNTRIWGRIYGMRASVVATIRGKTDWPLISGGAAPIPKVLGGLQPPQPPPASYATVS